MTGSPRYDYMYGAACDGWDVRTPGGISLVVEELWPDVDARDLRIRQAARTATAGMREIRPWGAK